MATYNSEDIDFLRKLGIDPVNLMRLADAADLPFSEDDVDTESADYDQED